MIKNVYEDWILKEDHPCIMAQTVFSQENFTIKNYGTLGSEEHIPDLYRDLADYVNSYDETTNDFQTFLAVFPDSDVTNEKEFEDLLWKELNAIHEIDRMDWDSEVSNDPLNENFSFSIAGKAFYIVGLHPKSSRLARRSPYPTIAFNLHCQFEKLRTMGVFQRVKKRIRKRDTKLQGFVNPMLEDFGNLSEARQYSGRKVEKTWKCPFLNGN